MIKLLTILTILFCCTILASWLLEIYALAVSKQVQNQGFSAKLLDEIMQKARISNFSKIFALTKYNTQWFFKYGFVQMKIDELPIKRQALFDHQRSSSIFFKDVN